MSPNGSNSIAKRQFPPIIFSKSSKVNLSAKSTLCLWFCSRGFRVQGSAETPRDNVRPKGPAEQAVHGFRVGGLGVGGFGFRVLGLGFGAR
jgi:hypothetical protein